MNAKTKAINPAATARKNTQTPYASWTDTETGWPCALLKSWQADNAKPFARWFMAINGDWGDTYVTDLLSGMVYSHDLVFDTNIWPTREAFLAWAKGSKAQPEPVKPLYIRKGDRVRILSRYRFTGTVRTAQNTAAIGAEDDWYIELDDDLHGYVYWKQGVDGGTVEKLK